MTDAPPIPVSRQVIEGYGAGRFRISGTVHEGSVLVLPARTLAWPVVDLSALAPAAVLASLSPMLPGESSRRAEVDLLLMGCGPETVPVAAAVRDPLRAAGIVVEAMTTGAACRTYNVLAAEGRLVAAALIAVE